MPGGNPPSFQLDPFVARNLTPDKKKSPYQLMGKGPEHSHVNRCGFQNGKNIDNRNKIKYLIISTKKGYLYQN